MPPRHDERNRLIVKERELLRQHSRTIEQLGDKNAFAQVQGHDVQHRDQLFVSKERRIGAV